MAAGAADCLGSCLVLADARPILAAAGAGQGLRELRARAARAGHAHAAETAEAVRGLLEPAGWGAPLGAPEVMSPEQRFLAAMARGSGIKE